MSGIPLFRRSAYLCGLALLYITLAAGGAFAQKVVLLPVADLSRGENGLNLGLTKAVESALERLGLEVIPMGEALRFMSENKLRSYSYLDSFQIQKIGRGLHAQLVLVGTVTELGDRDPSIGLTFTAYETGHGKPIWAETAATGIREQIKALGIGEPETMDDLVIPLIDGLLGHFREEVYGGFIPEVREYQLVGMQVTPAYSRGGQLIEGNLKIRFLGARPTLIAARSAAGRTYLQYDKRTNSWWGSWYAPQDEGTYPIDIYLDWGRDLSTEKIDNIARFEVINTPPGLTIEIKKGQRIGQRLAFNNHLLILPRVGNLSPMARWALEIRNEKGTTVVTEEHEGDIPERLVWEGRGPDGFRLPNGTYDIMFHLWDLAGNKSSATRRVVLQASPPKITANAQVLEEKGVLFLTTEGTYEFPLVSWKAELKSLTGELLAEVKGTELPAEIPFQPVSGEQTAYLNLTGEDLLGNRLRMNRQKMSLVETEADVEEQKAKSWVPDF